MVSGQYASQRTERRDIELHTAADESGFVSAYHGHPHPAFKARHPSWQVGNLIHLSRENELLGHGLEARTTRRGAQLKSGFIRR